MGQEIDDVNFDEGDFQRFSQALASETDQLREWFDTHAFSERDRVAGSELEAWLVAADRMVAPVNDAYLAGLDNDQVVSELARFNIEMNTPPVALSGDVFSRMQDNLDRTWDDCSRHAHDNDLDLAMIGILPTLRESDLTLDNMSGMKRYQALNEQVIRRRHGRPLVMDVFGNEHLRTRHFDVMAESAATSFQLHLKVSQDNAVRFFNASQIVAAPMVALAANSPFLFGKDLWAETRIPLFEQAVVVGGFDGGDSGPMRRVTFGSGYLRESVFECFEENLEHYPVLLPMHFDGNLADMNHLRLHNGTIWRWNRPLIGFDADGTPHLRIEHRVLPSGPTITDLVANAAVYYGLVFALGQYDALPEMQLPFSEARDNFYAAAREGLEAPLTWLDGRTFSAHQLLLEELLPLAGSGLVSLGIDSQDIERYVGIVEQRVTNGQNGSAWQRAYWQANNRDFAALTAAYLEHQSSGQPVHTWSI